MLTKTKNRPLRCLMCVTVLNYTLIIKGKNKLKSKRILLLALIKCIIHQYMDISDFLFRLRRESHVLCQRINLLKKYALKKYGTVAFSTHETIHHQPYIVKDKR